MAAKKKPTGARAELFPADVAARVPADLREVFTTTLPSYEGTSAYAIPYRSATDKLPVRFDPHAAWDILGSYGDSLPQTASFVPLAVLGRGGDNECFAVDPRSAGFPVYFFEHEAGFHAFAPSLDSFLKRLLKKGEKSPFDKLEKAVEKAETLNEKEKHKEVVALLEPAVEGLPQLKYGDGGADDLARAYNFLGLAYRDLKREEDAIVVFERAKGLCEDNATLNLISLYEDRKDFAKAIATGEDLRTRAYAGRDPYEWFWARNYLGRCYLRTGDVVRATRAYHEIHAKLAIAHPKYMAEARVGLEQVVGEGGRRADDAKAILGWFTATVKPTESEAKQTRAWWTGLAEPVRHALSKSASLEADPSDEALALLVRTERLDLDGAKVADLAFLAAFSRVDHVDAEKHALADLSTLPAMPKLEYLSLAEGKLESLEGIERVPNVEYLRLEKNKLSSIADLAKVPRLRELKLDDNRQIDDLGPLSEHVELEELELRATAVADLTPLAGCVSLAKVEFLTSKIAKGLSALLPLTRLKELGGVTWKVPEKEARAFLEAKPEVEIGLDGYKRRPGDTTDQDRVWWRALGKNPALRDAIRKDRADSDEPIDDQLRKLHEEDFFSLGDSNIESIAEIATFPNTRFVAIERNPVADLSPLGDLPRLETIRAPGSKVTSIAGLRNARRLDELDLAGAPLASLDGAEGLVSLVLLAIDDAKVTSLAPLGAIDALRKITFSGAPVTSVAPLANHPRLAHVDCSASRVVDLAPLAANTRLTRIDCWGNPGLTGLMKLVGLLQLNAVYSRGSLSAAELEAFRKERPDVDVD